jgi:hypothetical protein
LVRGFATAASSSRGKLRIPLLSARKKLAENGAAALQPTVVVHEDRTQTWFRADIPKRVANSLRKESIREGTYGSFDTQTLKGWDPAWDVELAINKSKKTNGGDGRIRIRKPKGKKRERTREDRALKIEKALVGMEERIEEVHKARIDSKPNTTSFEYKYKKAMAIKTKNK